MNKKYTALAVAMLIGMSCTSSYAKDMWLQNQSGHTIIILIDVSKFTLSPGETIKGLPWAGAQEFQWSYVGIGEEYRTPAYNDVSSFVVYDGGKYKVKGYVSFLGVVTNTTKVLVNGAEYPFE